MDSEGIRKILARKAVLRADEVAEILGVSIRTIYRRAMIDDPLIRLVSRRPCRIAAEPLRRALFAETT